MFGIILLAAAALMHLYVFWRWSSARVVGPVRQRVAFTAAGLLWVGLVLARSHGRAGGPIAATTELVGMSWLGSLFLLFVLLLAVDVATGFGSLLPRHAPHLRGWALIAGGVLSVAACAQGVRAPAVVEHEVRLADLPEALDGTVVVALSDLHLGRHLGTEWLAERTEQVRALKPDLVVLLGDIFEGRDGPRDEWAPHLRSLAPRLGTFAVLGNHDMHGGGARSLAVLEQAGIEVLRNRSVQVRPGLVLAGTDDLTTHRRRGLPGDLVAQALAGRPEGATVLLSHTPWNAEGAARAGADLMLSGHTHGGQIWPFAHLVALQYPLVAGRYDVAGMAAIVCRGTGTWGPRMRLWERSEMLRVTLRRAPAENRR